MGPAVGATPPHAAAGTIPLSDSIKFVSNAAGRLSWNDLRIFTATGKKGALEWAAK